MAMLPPGAGLGLTTGRGLGYTQAVQGGLNRQMQGRQMALQERQQYASERQTADQENRLRLQLMQTAQEAAKRLQFDYDTLDESRKTHWENYVHNMQESARQRLDDWLMRGNQAAATRAMKEIRLGESADLVWKNYDTVIGLNYRNYNDNLRQLTVADINRLSANEKAAIQGEYGLGRARITGEYGLAGRQIAGEYGLAGPATRAAGQLELEAARQAAPAMPPYQRQFESKMGGLAAEEATKTGAYAPTTQRPQNVKSLIDAAYTYMMAKNAGVPADQRITWEQALRIVEQYANAQSPSVRPEIQTLPGPTGRGSPGGPVPAGQGVPPWAARAARAVGGFALGGVPGAVVGGLTGGGTAAQQKPSFEQFRQWCKQLDPNNTEEGIAAAYAQPDPVAYVKSLLGRR